MGLDSVEILMKVEDTFGIKIPDREAEQIITVGDFHAAVWRHLSGKHSNRCKSQSLFYKLRKSFTKTFNFSSQHFRLDTPPDEIFPRAGRRQAYLSFSNITNLKLPDLVLTRPWATLLNLFGVITILGSLVVSLVLINFFDNSKWTLLIPVAGIIMTHLLSELLDPKRTEIRASNIRLFTQETLALNYASIVSDQGTNRLEMETVINYIISDMVGLEIEEVTSEKKIGDDLGID